MNKTANTQYIDDRKDTSERTGINWGTVLQGFIVGLCVLAGVAFWGTFAYSMIVEDVELAMTFGKIIGIMVGVFVPLSILYTLYKKFVQS